MIEIRFQKKLPEAFALSVLFRNFAAIYSYAGITCGAWLTHHNLTPL